jgi:hypothetical protein
MGRAGSVSRHIDEADLRRLQAELAQAQKLHPLDDKADAERQLERLLRIIQRERS